jgi:hypothetical protein
MDGEGCSSSSETQRLLDVFTHGIPTQIIYKWWVKFHIYMLVDPAVYPSYC